MAPSALPTHFSTGVVEISAVATLIGAPIVEAMSLGLKSAACLPWASISSFGLLHVVKVSLAAAVPDWIREPLGLQNASVDAALGLCDSMYKDKQVRSRVDLGDVRGISVKSSRDGTEVAGGLEKPLCIYRLDRATQLVLDTIPQTEPGMGVLIHEFVVDPGGHHQRWKDWLALLLSLAKVSEITALWLCGSGNLLLIFTSLPWAYGFSCGLLLLRAGLSRDQDSTVQTDIISGQLPSPLHQGACGKVVIGMPRNCRRSRAWKFTWTFYTVVTLVSVIGTFVVLGRNNAKSIYTWMAFQALWLLGRAVVFYFVESAAGTRQGLAIGTPWETASVIQKQRALALLMALSSQQALLHPRGAAQYAFDVVDVDVINTRFADASWALSDHIQAVDQDFLATVRIVDVVGDTVLRSVSWMKGAGLRNNEMYDSALVFLKVAGRCIAVPSVRVCFCTCPRTGSKIWPRGDSHGEVCKTMVWVIWIPLRMEKHHSVTWVEAKGAETKGNMELVILTTDQLDKSFAGGEMLVSFKSIGELDPVLQVSRAASHMLMSMMLGVAPADRTVRLEKV